MSPRARSGCTETDAAAWEAHLGADEEILRGLRLDDHLRQRWALRLVSEWEALNWVYDLGLRTPAFAITSGDRRVWGSWDPEHRIISVSERQIACYTWASVVETLKHEMAHQFVDERMGGDPNGPHGPRFAMVCHRLGISPKAAGDGGVPLDRPSPSLSVAEDDVRLRRIRKLLALADDRNNEHEAQLALGKAQALILEYNVEVARVGKPVDDDTYTFRTVLAPGKRIGAHLRRLSAILTEFFFVQAVWMKGYDARRDETVNVLELMGTPFNVDMAEYVWHYLQDQSERLYASYKRSAAKLGAAAKAHYLDGVIAGFGGHLREEARALPARSAEKALIITKDGALTRYCHRRHPRLRSFGYGGGSRSEARAAGEASGREIRVRRPIEEGPARRGHLLGKGG